MKRFHQSHIPPGTVFDIIIIGGGATGLGTALDAASRGFNTLLVEQSDFAKGTSSRSTKLVHGGVRYLAQGDVDLVKHALKERGLLWHNARHLVSKEEFLIPCYSWFSVIKYLAGLTLYDWLAGKYSFGKSKYFSREKSIAKMPGIKEKGLKGCISYYDGKFDDARLAVNLAQTAVRYGATLLTYTKVTGLTTASSGNINGVVTEDVITGNKSTFSARVVINATGVFVDDIIKMSNAQARPMVRPSQGVHIVLHKHFLNTEAALMIPKTSDGRVLFAVPWHDRVLVGTTDTPLKEHLLEPRALQEEIDFILKTAGLYLTQKPLAEDILSVFSGLRPLAATTNSAKKSTKEISRDHKLVVSPQNLITITGGKWTTYRKMAEETVELAVSRAQLQPRACVTHNLTIHGSTEATDSHYLNIYGTDRLKIAELILKNPALNQKLHPGFPHVQAEVVWIAQHEMAETVEDILARRLRVLFVDAKAAKEMAPTVGTLMAAVFQFDQAWEQAQVQQFHEVANGYLGDFQFSAKSLSLEPGDQC
ncbi:glycerol-3-phosphate dehydrogenase/oxidase [Pedobacter frigidisoli]|uniref:glycerol-3-phosphate dehydrogenase/oxidase n=1 Tax=Pedobacter frigidisoli TaxID=2530455 RepID=UPI0029319D31|nr:glycerol-3-phosphate dehydrogenase/oxidase [Pedobacter frigidisoli]